MFLDKDRKILYVGKAKNLKSRVSSYFSSVPLGKKTAQLVDQIKLIDVTIVDSEFESLLFEAHLIKKYKPKYNVMLTDNKMYPLIRITKKETFPAVLTARRSDDKKSVYFGPFPSAGAVRLVLRTLRRIFPFKTSINHSKKICLYNHLGLCPCPEAIHSEQVRKDYRKNIARIIKILEGKSISVKRDLEREMKTMGKKERYEEAKELKRQLDAFNYVTQPFHLPFEYDENPNLRVDIRQKELLGLSDVLNRHSLAIGKLTKIECFDISNIQGKFATGSLVVLTDGEIDKSQYRRFRIRRENRPNDVAMMAEVLQRRIKRNDWPLPDLIIVDGGKAQVGAALAVVNGGGLNLPIIGLAKREETIIIQKKNVIARSPQATVAISEIASSLAPRNDKISFIEVSLPKDSPALHLIQRIRDEAHRFAITYHKHLRSQHIKL